MKVLYVEDDPIVAAAVEKSFAVAGFQVDWCMTAVQARQRLDQAAYGAVLLDVCLPDGDGLEICRGLRARGDLTPVVVYSGRTAQSDVLQAYDAGASLCLKKTIGGPELVAHFRAIVQRPSLRSVAFGPAVLNLEESRLELPGGRTAELSCHECRLCLELARHPGMSRSRDDLVASVWGATEPNGNALDVLVFRIRKKLGELSPMVQTERGVGYRLMPAAGAAPRRREQQSGTMPVVPGRRASDRPRRAS